MVRPYTFKKVWPCAPQDSRRHDGRIDRLQETAPDYMTDLDDTRCGRHALHL